METKCLNKQIIMYTFGYEIYKVSITIETEIKIIIYKKNTHTHTRTYLYTYKQDLPV